MHITSSLTVAFGLLASVFAKAPQLAIQKLAQSQTNGDLHSLSRTKSNI